MPFGSFGGLYDSSSRVVETTISTVAFFVVAMELIPDVVINGGIYTKNENENDISRDPGQGKSVPKRSYRQVTVSPLRYVRAGIVDKGQGCH